MKVHTIEIAEAIEKELKKYINEWGGGYPMRFTRFIDLGGQQTDLYVYQAPEDAPPWMIIRIKSSMRSEQGECIQYFVNIVDTERKMEEVMVSPEIWKLPALADKILNFARNDLLEKVSDGSGTLPEGQSAPELGGSSPDDDEDYDDLDTSGILAGDSSGGDADFDPSELIASANDEDDKDGDSGFDPEDVIKE